MPILQDIWHTKQTNLISATRQHTNSMPHHTVEMTFHKPHSKIHT